MAKITPTKKYGVWTGRLNCFHDYTYKCPAMFLSEKDKKYFFDLLHKYNEGRCTTEESVFVENYLRILDYRNSDALENFEQEKENIKLEIKEQLLITINNKPQSIIYHRVHFLRTAWFRYAAAIILVLGVGAYLWNSKSPGDRLTTSNNKQAIITPGKDVAFLTLGGGKTILLDTASNGVLAHEGNIEIIKRANGEIAYDSKNGVEGSTVMNTMTTPKGGKYQLSLPDGSKIWLNSASTVKYPTYFSGNERKIFISGEIYIEVAKDKTKPFIVDVNGKSSIEVLGTQFNINSYDDEDNIKTTLIEGSVKVISATNRFLLKPGQQLNGIRIIDHPNIEQVVAWKNGFLNFDNSDIKTVMRQIARWYNIDVFYEGNPPTYKLMGELPMDASIEQVYKILRNVGVQFRVEGRKIIITK